MTRLPHRPRWLLPLALDLVVLLASFYPQWVHPRDTVAYVGDALESVYIVGWNAHQIVHDPLHLFEANVLYPLPHALAFTDHRLLPSLAVAPVVWLTRNPVLAYNLAIALACLLAAAGGRRLAGVLGLDPVGAWAAGALYAFHTYQVHEASRLNIIFHGFIPFALAEVLLLLRTGRRRHAWGAAGFLLLQGLSSNYHLLYGVLLLGMVAVVALVAEPRVAARRLAQLAPAGLVAALLFVPMALPYLDVARRFGHSRELPFSMGLEHYLATDPGNLLYGAIGEVGRQQRGPHFTGFVPLALAALALVAALRKPREGQEGDAGVLPARVWVPIAAGFAVVLMLLSLGRNVTLMTHGLAPGPYRLLYAYVPGFKLVRIPERLGLLAMLFLGLLAGHGLTLLRRGGRTRLALALAAVIPLEHLSPHFDPQHVRVGDAVPQVYRWLASQPVRALAEVPIHGEGLVREETLEMYDSTYHFRPTIAGYTAYPPLATRLLRRFAAQFPTGIGLAGLARVGVDTVVVHTGREVGQDLARQLPGSDSPDHNERLARLLALAGLDLRGGIPGALAEGRIALAARFPDPEGADEVYRLLPAPPRPAAPFPTGRVAAGADWVARASGGDPALARDGSLDTSWTLVDPLRGDETFELQFDRPLEVSGLVIRCRWDSVLPTRFRVDGRTANGDWEPVARYNEPQALQLLDSALRDPAAPTLGFDLQGRTLSGVRLAVEAGGTSFDGWTMPELDVLVR